MILSPLEDAVRSHGSATPDTLWRYLVANIDQRAVTNTFDSVVTFERLRRDCHATALRTAQLICTDQRWRRVTSALVIDIERSGILDEPALDQLADGFPGEHARVAVPEEWLRDGRGRGHKLFRGSVAAIVGVIALTGNGCGGLARRQGATGPSDVRTVVRVVDGDTIIVNPNKRIRLIGIDAPESVAPNRPVDCMGRESSQFLKEFLPKGTPVRLAIDVEPQDRYGRTLAYVWVASTGVFVNAELVRRGFA